MNLSKGFALQRGYRSLSELLKMRSEEANLNNKKKGGGGNAKIKSVGELFVMTRLAFCATNN